MKKLLFLLLFIPLVSFGQLTYDEKNAIASDIFETFNENYIKQSALEFLRLDDKAIAMAQKKFPNPYDWEAQIDYQREIENQDRLAWYKKQKWWKKIKKNESVAFYVRAKIIGYAYDKGWYDGL